MRLNMTRLPKKKLKELFESIVGQSGTMCGEGNPFILEKGNFKCYVFIKNISPAYYSNYPDNSRVQLPSSDRFKEVIESNLDFLILGYDNENEVFAAWNPSLIKDRLNEKTNVSVYSRFSWQRSVTDGKFEEHHLGNDEKILLFKKELLNEYFDQYRILFELPKNVASTNIGSNRVVGVDLKEVQNIINPLLKEHKVLQAVALLEDILKSESEYKELSFKDYFEIVNKMYKDFYG